MDKKNLTLKLCACVLLLALGLAIGRYSALSRGAVVSAGSGARAFMPNIEARTASAAGSDENWAKININLASALELTELPGIGDALAQRIVEYREQNGEFESIEEIMAVRGIGESVFSKIRDYIYIE